LVVGNREMQDGTLSVRGRSGSNVGNKTVAEVLDLLRAEVAHTQREFQHTL
jgi:threonyl-tRNA synthetase